MHEALFKSGWKEEKLMQEHRKALASVHRGKGKAIIVLGVCRT